MNNRIKYLKEKDPECVPLQSMTLNKEIGSGGYATVWQADYNSNRVAVKAIVFYKFITQAENEKNVMKNLTALSAPNVVNYFGYSIDGNQYYILMEYMNRGSLHNAIRTEKAFTWPCRISIMRDMTTAINFLHTHQFVHRDIKAANVLLNQAANEVNITAKLCDFGMSMKAKLVTASSTADGTLNYIPPEIWQGKRYTEESDIYSLAVTCWEMAAWKKAFDGDGIVWLGCNIPKGIRPVIPADVPQKIASLITWGWQNDPNKRPTAKKLLQDLDEAAKELKLFLA